MLQVALKSLVRHGLTVGAGWLIARGVLSDEQASGAVREAVDILAPLLLAVLAVGWSIISRKLEHWKP